MDRQNIAQNELYCMGTLISQKIFGPNSMHAIKASELEIKRLNNMLSRFVSDSDITKINSAAGLMPVMVSDEAFRLLKYSAECSRIYNGCFDITVGSIATLWNEYKIKKISPVRKDIRKQLAKVNFRDILFDPDNSSVLLKKKGQSIDLGGIAKGYASDKVLEVYKNFGIESAFVNFGGNVAVLGSKPDDSPWNVGIRHPRHKDSVIGVVAVKNKSVITSGDYQRYYIDNSGKHYHHILNPKTGYPANSGLISVTVVAESGVLADALSTIFFIAGVEKSIRILEYFPNIDVVFIDNDLNLSITPKLTCSFIPLDGIKVSELD